MVVLGNGCEMSHRENSLPQERAQGSRVCPRPRCPAGEGVTRLLKHKNRKIRMTQMSHVIPWLQQPGGSSQSCEQQFRAQRFPLPARCRRWRGESAEPGGSRWDRAARGCSAEPGHASPGAGPVRSRWRQRGSGGERGCGSGEGECGLKWPRRAAGVGCAMRAGQNRTGERGQRQRGGQPSASRPPENALCHRLAVVIRKVRVRGVPPLNFWVPDLVPPHLLHPGGESPFPLPVPLRGLLEVGELFGKKYFIFCLKEKNNGASGSY